MPKGKIKIKTVFKKFAAVLLAALIVFASTLAVYGDSGRGSGAGRRYFYPTEDFYSWLGNFLWQTHNYRTVEQLYSYYTSLGVSDSNARTMAQSIIQGLSLTNIWPETNSSITSVIKDVWINDMSQNARYIFADIYVQTTGRTGLLSGDENARCPYPTANPGAEDPPENSGGGNNYTVPRQDLDDALKYFDNYFRDNVNFDGGGSGASVIHIDDFTASVWNPFKAKIQSYGGAVNDTLLSRVFTNPYVVVTRSVRRIVWPGETLGYYHREYDFIKINAGSFYNFDGLNIFGSGEDDVLRFNTNNAAFLNVNHRSSGPVRDNSNSGPFSGNLEIFGVLKEIHYYYVVYDRIELANLSPAQIIFNMYDGKQAYPNTNNYYYYNGGGGMTDAQFNELLNALKGQYGGDVYNVTVNNFYEINEGGADYSEDLSLITSLLTGIREILIQIRSRIDGVIGGIGEMTGHLRDMSKNLANLDGFINIDNTVYNEARDNMWTFLGKTVESMFGGIADTISTAVGGAIGGVTSIITGAIDGVVELLGDVLDFFLKFFDRLLDFITGLFTLEDNYFSDKLDEYKSQILSDFDYESEFEDIISGVREEAIDDLTAPHSFRPFNAEGGTENPYSLNLDGITIVDMSYFNEVKENHLQGWIDGFFSILVIFYNLNQIYFLIRGKFIFAKGVDK